MDSWRAMLTTAVKSGDIQEILRSGGSLAREMRDTEQFLELLSEVQDALAMLIRHGEERALKAVAPVAQQGVFNEPAKSVQFQFGTSAPPTSPFGINTSSSFGGGAPISQLQKVPGASGLTEGSKPSAVRSSSEGELQRLPKKFEAPATPSTYGENVQQPLREAARGVAQVAAAATTEARRAVEGQSSLQEASNVAEGLKQPLASAASKAATAASSAAQGVAQETLQVARQELGVRPTTHEQRQQERDELEQKLMHTIQSLLERLRRNSTWQGIIERVRLAREKAEQKAEGAKEQTKEAIKQDITENPNATALMEDLKKTLQAAVGNQMNVEIFFEHARAAFNDITNNDKLGEILEEIQLFVDRIWDNPKLLDTEEIQREVQVLDSRFREAVDEIRNNPNLLAARHDGQEIVRCIRNDPLNSKLVDDTRQLLRDIKSDRPGELIDPQLIGELRRTIVPILLEHLDNVPLPSIDDSGEFMGKIDYHLENVKLSLVRLVPERVHVKVTTKLVADPIHLETDTAVTKIKLSAEEMQVHMKNVNWWYHRHSIPRMTDSGTLDLDTVGRGMNILVKMELSELPDSPGQHLLKITKARCHIDKFKLKIADSKHDTLYGMLSGLFAARIRHETEHVIEQNLRELGSTFDAQLTTLFLQARQMRTEITKAIPPAEQLMERAKEAIGQAGR